MDGNGGAEGTGGVDGTGGVGSAEIEKIVAGVRGALPAALVAIDFDGTLAPLVPDPESSRPVDGSIAALAAVARTGAQVAVITGRDARTAVRLGGLDAIPGLEVSGLYGLETWVGGALSTPDTPEALLSLRRRLPALVAEHGTDPDLWIEDKRLSLVLHARRSADPGAALAPLRRPVDALAAELGLEVHDGRDVLELRLAGFDKAGALQRLVAEREYHAVVYLGDDLGDLPAFAEIRRLRESGVSAWGIAVLSSGVDEVARAADAALPTPTDVVAFLQALAA